MDTILTVRPLAADDKPAWRALFDGYLAFYGASVDGAVIETTWTRLNTPADGHHIGLIAHQRERGPVGLAHVLFHRSTWSPTHYCYLEDLFVAPDARGHGAGRALIEAVYREADARGCTRTYWSTQEFNETARVLYDRVATLSPFLQYRR
ncbi:MAG: GNAT family N-acetyltransferase [Pseudomonadota bacterium]